MTIRIIDLLNKKASGEKLPKFIKYNNEVWMYANWDGDYQSEDDGAYLLKEYQPFEMLNDEVEIIEDTPIEVIDDKGNKTKIEIDLSLSELKPGEQIFKDGDKWYVRKLIEPTKEILDCWENSFKIPKVSLDDLVIHTSSEEDKKIEKLDYHTDHNDDIVLEPYQYRTYPSFGIDPLSDNEEVLMRKINEIIEVINNDKSK